MWSPDPKDRPVIDWEKIIEQHKADAFSYFLDSLRRMPIAEAYRADQDRKKRKAELYRHWRNRLARWMRGLARRIEKTDPEDDGIYKMPKRKR